MVLGFWRSGVVVLTEGVAEGRGGAEEDLFGYFPSLVVGVCDSDSQAIFRLKAGQRKCKRYGVNLLVLLGYNKLITNSRLLQTGQF